MTERIDVGAIRRTQIVEAARRVIARKGIQGASLSEIEQEAGVSRGVLTYHFHSKEDIILAVFDAMVAQMQQEAGAGRIIDRAGWERFEVVVEFVLTRKPQDDPLDCLRYTFLAQMSHREDFRARLAAEFAEVRENVVADLRERAVAGGHDDEELRSVATVALGAIHGLVMQQNVDPSSFDPARVIRVLKDMLLGYMAPGKPGGPPAGGRKRSRKRTAPKD